MSAPHTPVLLEEMLHALAPNAGDIYVDGTFGAGGYSRALLQAAPCTVYGIDRDPSVAEWAEPLAREAAGRFFLLSGAFGAMESLLLQAGVGKVQGIVLDIGVSSMQLDRAERGFSFQSDGPLDMRMSGLGESAADVVNNAEEAELADILYRYGDERKSRHIARAIVAARAESPITRTSTLAALVRRVVRYAGAIDPATRSFQALRIYVNDELGELERALEAALNVLAPGGRLVVVTFHALEDRIVKQFFQSRSGETRGQSRHMPSLGATQNDAAASAPAFFLPRKKAVTASLSEIKRNPRARSAKLRVAIRTENRHKEAA